MRGSLAVQRNGLTVAINDFKRALTHLASMVSGKGVKVVFKGTLCCTDNKTIYLPELSLLERKNMTADEVKKGHEFLQAIMGFLYHEISHILYTDPKEWEAGAKEGPLVRHGMNAIEDVRIEREFARAWRGSETTLRAMHEWMLHKMAETVQKQPKISKVMVGLAWVARTGRSHWFYKGLDDGTKEILKKFAPEIAAARRVKSTKEAHHLARWVAKKLTSKEQPTEEEMNTLNGGGTGAGGGGGDDGTGEEVPPPPPLSDEELEDIREEMDNADIEKVLDDALDQSKVLGNYIQAAGQDEDRYLIYTTEFDTLEPASATSTSTYSAMMAEARQHFGILKRNLQNLLKARADSMTISELEEGDLDTSLLYRLASGRSDKVFKEDVQHFDHNVGVVLLVNESASMFDGYGGMTRIQLARITAALMAEVLDAIGVPFACYGHTTGNNATQVLASADDVSCATYTRWGATHIRIYKDFDENFAATKTRFPSMRAEMNTHDAEALLFAGNKLLMQKGLSRRIVMTVDDGAPYPNVPYWVWTPPPTNPGDPPPVKPKSAIAIEKNIRSMLRRHQEYVVDVVKALTAQDVEVLGMGMACNVSQYYPKSIVVNDVASFPVIALKELRKLLLAPDAKSR